MLKKTGTYLYIENCDLFCSFSLYLSDSVVKAETVESASINIICK